MIKLLDFDPVDKYGEPTVRILPKKEAGVKLACSDAYAPEIRDFIASLKPVVGKLYALINAMGATEYFSCNRNGDAFYEDALKKYHHTFMEDGHAFMHHKNKDPEKSYGKVVFSAYNDKMHRVELIVEYDTDKLDKKFVDKINNGEMVNVSMGCRVDADYCSICGHKAKTPRDYCKHLKSEPGLTRMLPDGRKAFAINRDPHFFDISIVTIPADPTARIMAKIAGKKEEIVSSVDRAQEEFGYTEKTASGTEAKLDLNPENDSDKQECSCSCHHEEAPSFIGDAIKSLFDRFDMGFGPMLPTPLLDLIGGMSPNPIKILNSFIKKKIFLRPNETQRIILVSSGMKDDADILDKKGIVCFNDPLEGIKQFLKEPDCCMDAVEALPKELEESRKMTPDNIKKITVRVILNPDGEKTAGVQPVPLSDDFLYLLGQKNIRDGLVQMAPSLASKATKYGILGSLVAAFNTALTDRVSQDLLTSASMATLLAGPTIIDSINRGIHEANRPVQEMMFMNPNSPMAIEAALTDALIKAGIKTGSMKTAGMMDSIASGINSFDISKAVPKALVALPVAYGFSKLVAHEAKKDAMEEAALTGKYEPNLMSKTSLTLPLSYLALMKYASAKKTAENYVKTAEKFDLSKKELYRRLENILFE